MLHRVNKPTAGTHREIGTMTKTQRIRKLLSTPQNRSLLSPMLDDASEISVLNNNEWSMIVVVHFVSQNTNPQLEICMGKTC
jgi:hypothetical protein